MVFAGLGGEGGDEFELAVQEWHLLWVAGGPGAALFEGEVASAHGVDAFVGGHPPERFEAGGASSVGVVEELGEGL